MNLTAAGPVLVSQSTSSVAMATTVFYASSGGGPNEKDVVETIPVVEIMFEILNCNEATATVTLDGSDPMTSNASQLTRPLLCTDLE